MSIRSRVGPVTFAQFLEIVREDQKADLIDGIIYMASPENVEHNELVGWLSALMGLYVRHRRLGRVAVNRVAYRLGERTGPEPDLAFVRAEREAIIKHGYVDGPPDLTIEFISPDSVDRDYHDKRAKL
jgi:Uma2 family endonuclease